MSLENRSAASREEERRRDELRSDPLTRALYDVLEDLPANVRLYPDLYVEKLVEAVKNLTV